MRTDWDLVELNKQVKAGTPNLEFNLDVVRELRANRGHIKSGPFTAIPHLILTSVGAKSLQPRVRALMYATYKDKYVIVPSNGGGDKHSAWYYNLVAHPYAVIEVNDNTLTVRAELAEGALRDEVFAEACQQIPFWTEYKKRNPTREFPVFLLEVIGSAL